jgi:mono/diheme cytochrome c family protein
MTEKTPLTPQISATRQLRWAEMGARAAVVLLLFALLLTILAVRFLPDLINGREVIELRARMPEQGGWSQSDLIVQAGQPLHLSLVSDDVLHSFKIGQDDRPAIDLLPGKPVETTLTFEQPGKYTFYCTRWCGPNHWRMRGVIEVLAASGDSIKDSKASAPLYAELGIDIDAPHPAAVVPQHTPSAQQGALLGANISSKEVLSSKYTSQVYLRSHSPAQVWDDLRQDQATQDLSEQQVWDLVAYLWASNTSVQKLALGKNLYAENCAACHGEQGAGDGVFAVRQPDNDEIAHKQTGIDGHGLAAPADFSAAETMLGASSAVLQGKIVRGGMGTGMPYWGPVFTEEQIWALVDYLWTFQFDMEVER